MRFNKLIPELLVGNIRQSLTFYRQVLGFRVVYQRPREGFTFLEREEVQIMLEQIAKDSRLLAGKLQKPLGRGLNLQIEVRDVDALHRRVKRKGIKVFLPMEEIWYQCDKKSFGNRQFVVQDPDGYMLRFFKDLGCRQTKDKPVS